MSRFVKPEVVRIPISNGDFIDVKKRLNAGEQRTMFRRMASHMTPGENIRLDSEFVGLTKVLEYLVGWSLTEDGKPMPMSPDLPVDVRRSTLNRLDPEDFGEILRAIETHEDAQEKERAAAKNSQDGESVSSATSPSPSTTAGVTSGSMT